MTYLFGVDATNATCLGRNVNDSLVRFSNCTMKKVICNSKAQLVLFSIKEIKAIDELRYCYCDESLPWRTKGNIFVLS